MPASGLPFCLRHACGVVLKSLAATTLLVAGGMVVLPAISHVPLAGAQGADSITFTPSSSNFTFTVPSYVHSLHLVLSGAGGGNGNTDQLGPGGAGGNGTLVSGDLAVSPGESLAVSVGLAGGDGTVTCSPGSSAGGSAGGSIGSAAVSNILADPGSGGNVSSVCPGGGPGGGGGAASAVALEGTKGITLEAVAGGGGGGGGGGGALGYAGGQGGSDGPGSPGAGIDSGSGGAFDAATTAGAAQGAFAPTPPSIIVIVSAGAGGGGGGGYPNAGDGGGAGAPPPGQGAGGGGGAGGSLTSLLSNVSTGQGAGPDQNGYVTISWTPTPIGTTTTLSSSESTPHSGDQLTFSATVAPSTTSSFGAPSGTVSFVVGFYGPGSVYPTTPTSTTTLGPATLANGEAASGSYTVPSIAPAMTGRLLVQADYSGDTTYLPSTVELELSVLPPTTPTSTTVSASPEPAVLGQSAPLMLSATVTPTTTPPTGASFSASSVAFEAAPSDNPKLVAPLGQASVQPDGSATLSVPSSLLAIFLPGMVVTGSYSGNASFGSSAAQTTVEVVLPTTTTTLSSSSNPTGYESAVNFTAKVLDSNGQLLSGSLDASSMGNAVDFTDTYGAKPTTVDLGRGTESSPGTWTLITTKGELPPGPNTIAATYTDASGLLSSSKATLTQQVGQAATSLKLSATSGAARSIDYGASLPLSVVLSWPLSAGPQVGPPTGTITLSDPGTTLRTVGLSSSSCSTDATTGMTTCSLSAPVTFPPNTNPTLVASYSGDLNYSSSTDTESLGALGLSVVKDPTTTTLMITPQTSTVGQGVTFSARVTANPPGSGTPTGTVTFTDGTTTLGTAALNSSGTAALSLSSLAAGTHQITASYAGDQNFDPSTSKPATLAVSASTPTTTTPTENSSGSTTASAATASPTQVATAPAATAAAGAPSSGTAARTTGATLPLTGADIAGAALAAALLIAAGTLLVQGSKRRSVEGARPRRGSP